MGKKSGPGSGMNNPDHISGSYFRELRNNFWVKILEFLEWGSGIFLTLYPGWKKLGSGINILEPQH
jgi:hypothetical protein